jgi:choline kinase
MKCLIIAAGKGSRLHKWSDSKPLVQVLGVPLIERSIRSAVEAGADDFYVVTGYQRERVQAFLGRLAERLGIPITTLINEAWEKENGFSVLRAREYLHEPFLLLMADHLFDPSIAREMMAHPPAEGETILAVDGDIRNPLVDMEDVTRVKTEDGKIRNIGKGLAKFNGFDTGIFFCTPAIFEALDHSTENYGETTLSGAVSILANVGRARTFHTSGRFWIDVDDPAAFRRAENALLNRLRGKSHDGPVSRYLNRPLSIRISRHLVKYQITPSQSVAGRSAGTVCLGH